MGIITDSGSETRENISSAVSENIELKRQIDSMQEEIDSLNKRIEDLNNELESRPTIEPTPYAAPNSAVASPAPTQTVAPRRNGVD